MDMSTRELLGPDGARARVTPYGGQVLSWVCAGGHERLFLSQRSQPGPGVSVRGGAPVIFPRFAERPLLPGVPRHGFARTAVWTPEPGDDPAELWMRLDDSAATRAVWDARFMLRMGVRLESARLVLSLQVTAPADAVEPLRFEAALHTYLAVSDVQVTRLSGLAGAAWIDNRDPAGRIERDHEPALGIPGEVDRTYPVAPTRLLLESDLGRLRLEHTGFADVVVWNPGPDKAAALKDLQTGGWQSFLCVEPAQLSSPVVLSPGATWMGTQVLQVI